MHPIKYVWALRAVVYKPFFKHIGKMSYIGKPCFIEGSKGISIGNRTRIFSGIRMEAIDNGKIIIGDNVAIEQNAHIISHTLPLSIGNDTTISAGVYISNVNHKYENIHKSVMDQDVEIKKTIIGDNCFIGYGASILPGTILGKHCIVGANSVIKGTFPDNSIIVGAPGKIVKRYDETQQKWSRSSV